MILGIVLGILFAFVFIGTVWSCCHVAGLSDKNEEDEHDGKN